MEANEARDYIRDILNMTLELVETGPSIHERIHDLALAKRDALFELCDYTTVLPREGETLALTTGSDKTAALLYDRVFSNERDTPAELRFYVPITAELWASGAKCVLDAMDEVATEEGDEGREVEIRLQVSALATVVLGGLHSRAPADLHGEFVKAWKDGHWRRTRLAQNRDYLRLTADRIRETSTLEAVPVFDTAAQMQRNYQEGDLGVVMASLSNLGIVKEESLSMVQVREFRKDKASRTACRRFVHWLDAKLVGKSQKFVEDEIALKLEDREAAFDKHGIERVSGAITGFLDAKSLKVAAPGGFFGALTGSPVGAALAAGAVKVGKVAVKVVRHLLRREDVHGQHKEIAYVYELKKEFGTGEDSAGGD